MRNAFVWWGSRVGTGTDWILWAMWFMIFGHGQNALRTADLKDRCDCDMATKDHFPVTLQVDTQLEINLVSLIISLVN